MQDFEEKIIDIMEGKSPEAKFGHPTIFHELVKSDLPSQEKTVGRLNDEAQLVVAAGLVTTAWALSVASFHIINNTSIFQKLRKELEQAIPDINAPLYWQQVELLPYLNACMREGIRLSYGVTARNPRLSPKPLIYNGWTIPPRTPVSMTIVNHNHNEEIFPDSHSFLPERWLENKTRSGADLDRYFFSFGKGSRSCLGIK
jgi:cytochrome P450